MCDLTGIRVGCAMTGSFCTFKQMFGIWEELRDLGADLMPIMSYNACATDTRFYPAKEAVRIFEEIAGRKIINTVPLAEPIGPKKLLDVLVVAPCTGNTLAKIANGITDTPVTLSVKSHLRNGRPVVIAVSSNDALGQNARNLGALLQTRNIFFVPLQQDDWTGKPNSLVALFDLTAQTIEKALEGNQLQPILRENSALMTKNTI